MDVKEFLKEKGISNNDFMDSGVSDLIETLLTEYQALQLQQTGVMQRNCNSFGCVDPDNSGQCIYCGKILDND